MPRPMAEGDFWSLVSTMQGRNDDEALGRLTDALRARPAKDVAAFQERLARVLHELDREVLASQPVRFRGDPPDGDPIPLSDDSFLYLRTGIVIAGRATYERVLADPTVLADGEWDECEDLLYVAEEVLGDEVETKVSYETGANTKHWSPGMEPEREPWDQGLRLASIDARDLSVPIEGERPTADGGWEPFVFYAIPQFLKGDLLYDVSTGLARILALNGGLPEQLAVAHVVAVIDFGDAWQLEPDVGEPIPSEFGEHLELRVRVAVPSHVVRGWKRDAQRAGLSALAAACLLAVLPAGHPAVDELRQTRDVASHLLPT
jgi:Protein of unknown function (DUF4240)